MSSKQHEEANPAEMHPAPLTAKEFEAISEFQDFRRIMRGLLSVPKVKLDRKVKAAKKRSPRAGNPNAPGRKPNQIE
jgi:hypothetical protein